MVACIQPRMCGLGRKEPLPAERVVKAEAVIAPIRLQGLARARPAGLLGWLIQPQLKLSHSTDENQPSQAHSGQHLSIYTPPHV